jgi:hypothetical protein
MTFTPEAQAIWDRVPEDKRARLLDSAFCAHCLARRHLELLEGELRNNEELALIGKCSTCGHRLVQIIHLS